MELVDPPDDGRFLPRKFAVKLQNEKSSVRVTAKRFLHCFTFLSQNERITEKKNYHGLNVWHLETNIVLFVC